MNAVAYCHPFVPPEWIAAHGLRPCWLPSRAGDEPAVLVRRGACPVAAAWLDDFNGELPADAVVLTTTCDQIRYAASLLQHRRRLPVFLLHVPRTWQTAAVRAFYGEELDRLGRFLVACGGTAPTGNALSQTMLRYDRARAALRLQRGEMPAGAYARAIAVVRGDLAGGGEMGGNGDIERGRRGDMETRGHGDVGTGGRGDLSLSASPPLRVSASLPRPAAQVPCLLPWRSSAGRCPKATTNC